MVYSVQTLAPGAFLVSTCITRTSLEFFPLGTGAVPCPMAHGMFTWCFLLGVAVTKCCRECQALISSCVWLMLLQGRTRMSMVLLVRAYCLQPRAELAGLSLEQERWVRASHSSQVRILVLLLN